MSKNTSMFKTKVSYGCPNNPTTEECRVYYTIETEILYNIIFIYYQININVIVVLNVYNIIYMLIYSDT